MTPSPFFDGPAAAVAQCQLQTRWGPTLLRRTARGLSGIWHVDQAHFPTAQTLPDEPQHPWFEQTARLLEDWLNLAVDPPLPPLDPQGTAFQRAVWALLLTIPRGAWSSYGALALQLGDTKKSRAVGAAVGRNPIGILIPCHRVLGSQKTLTGYAAGLPMKRCLLSAEGVPYVEALDHLAQHSDTRQLELLPSV